MSMDRIIREEARLVILRELDQQPDGRLTRELLRLMLEQYGINNTRDWVHDELRWLADIGAVTVASMASVRIAAITAKGRDHVERRILIEGVKRPSPGGD
jgi:hypothetical protein